METSDIGYELLKEHDQDSFPTQCRGEEIDGIDLVLLDADTYGCLSTYYGRSGKRLKLDDDRIHILQLCKTDLETVLPKLSGDAKEYYDRLLRISDIVLLKIRNESSQKKQGS